MIVTFVGAGSFDFTGPALRSLMPVAARHGLRIYLCDRDPEALAAMENIARRLAEEYGARVPIERFTDVEPAVKETSFVIITLNHGGLEADLADFHHGFFPKHVDTFGPAGWLRALRMGSFMRSLLSALPSGATVLDLSNPLSLIVRMAHRRGFRALGFCHGAMNRRASFKSWLGLREDPEMVVWGTNHLSYLTTLRGERRDLYPELVKFLRSSPDHRNWRYNVELYDLYGMMPVLETQHIADSFPGFNDEQSMKDYGLHLWECESRRANAENRRRRIRAFASGESPISEVRASSEGVAEVIDALLGGPPHRGILNAPTPEPTNGMPAGAIAEGWMMVSSRGVDFKLAPSLPKEIQQHLYRIHRQQDLALEAFETGNLEKLVEVYLLEPNLTEEFTARSMLQCALQDHETLLLREWG